MYPKNTEEVSAFGRKHAEHARRFYQKGIQIQEFRQGLIQSSLSSISSKPISNSNSSQISGAAASGSTGLRKAMYPKNTEEVSAFGRKHAEHARRFYQKGIQIQEFRQGLLQSYRSNYCSMQVSNHMQARVTKGRHSLGEQVFDSGIKREAFHGDLVTSQLGAAVIPQSNETVLKVATITARPCKKQVQKKKTSLVSSLKLLENKREKRLWKKSVDFQLSKSEIDLLNAPLFQILCEISNT